MPTPTPYDFPWLFHDIATPEFIVAAIIGAFTIFAYVAGRDAKVAGMLNKYQRIIALICFFVMTGGLFLLGTGVLFTWADETPFIAEDPNMKRLLFIIIIAFFVFVGLKIVDILPSDMTLIPKNNEIVELPDVLKELLTSNKSLNDAIRMLVDKMNDINNNNSEGKNHK